MPDFWNKIYQDILHPLVSDPQLYSYLIVLALLLLLTSIILIKLRRRRKVIRVFNNHAGHIHVTHRALADLVHSACEKVGSIHKPRVSFTARRGKLQLCVKLKLEEGKRLAEVSTLLQSQLCSTLQETLSIEKIGRIDIITTGFIKSPHASGNDAAPLIAQVPDDHSEPVAESAPTQEPLSTNAALETPAVAIDSTPTSADPTESIIDADAEDEFEKTAPQKRSFFGFRSKPEKKDAQADGVEKDDNDLEDPFPQAPADKKTES